MRILIFNWKDTAHPLAGGAEYVTKRFAEELVKRGHHVTLIASIAPGLSAYERINDVDIYRGGSVITVRIFALWIYFKKFRNNADIVIDQIHGIPFFTPLYVHETTLAWIHEIAGTIWDYDFSLPFSYIGKVAEKLYFKFYRNTQFLCDTSSTKNELVHYGLEASQCNVISLTIDKVPKRNIKKNKDPLLCYIGRISPMKRIELLIEATRILIPVFPKIKVIIVGYGKPEYVDSLQECISQNKLSTFVEIKSRCSEAEKWELFARSWLHINPSVKEGFGLTVLEAASQTTPTIAFAVPGLKSTIKNGENGFCVAKESSQALAEKITELLTRRKKLEQLQKRSYNWYAKLHDWKDQTRKLELLLKKAASF